MSIATESPRSNSKIVGGVSATPTKSRYWSFDSVAPVALFAATLCIYVKTLCPTIFADDCGEIATAVVTGGVMHPPGYPLYTLIGRMFVAIIPFGEPAWRLGLISALAAAGAVSMTYRLARRAGAEPLWSIASALVFAFSLSLWRQATKVETYALNALFVTLILNAAAAFNETGSRRDLLITALLCGLSLTNHLSIVCVLPAACALIAPHVRASRRPIALAAATIAVAAAPLGLYALIWIAAAHHPGGQIWGDPSNPHRFFLQVSGARYRGYLTSQSWPGMIQRDLVGLPALLWRNLGWFLIAVVPGAASGLLRPQTRRVNQALLISLCLYLAQTTAYGILNIFEYYTPIVLILCVWAGVGMEAVMRGWSVKLNRPALGLASVQIGVVALVCAVALASHWSACDRSRATFIRDLAINTLRTMPPNAVLISVGDNRNFPMWYAQDVLGYRRDVTVVPRSMLGRLSTADGRDEMGWLLEKLQRRHPTIVDAQAILSKCASNRAYSNAEGPTWDIASNALRAGLPVLLTDVEPQDLAYSPKQPPEMTSIGPALTLEPYGLANLIVPAAKLPSIAQQAQLNLALERKMDIENAPGVLMLDEPDGDMSNEVYSQMLCTVGSLLARAGDLERAYAQVVAAVALSPTAPGYDELGYVCARTGRFEQSAHNYSVAVSLQPANAEYQMQLHVEQNVIQRMRAARVAPSPPSATGSLHTSAEYPSS